VRPLALAVAAFAVMEPVTAATHRFVMHGVGERLHRSHHRSRAAGEGRWEANDAYPAMFAAVVLVAMYVGFNAPGWSGLVPLGIGITLYGAAYALVHDVYIHGRLRWFDGRSVGVLDRLAGAHRVHHLFGGAPFGMLVPVVPRVLRERAGRTGREPLRQRVAATPGP
jgi:beta-carotene 3-hydroxylase